MQGGEVVQLLFDAKERLYFAIVVDVDVWRHLRIDRAKTPRTVRILNSAVCTGAAISESDATGSPCAGHIWPWHPSFLITSIITNLSLLIPMDIENLAGGTQPGNGVVKRVTRKLRSMTSAQAGGDRSVQGQGL
jgi:hypothetical protein